MFSEHSLFTEPSESSYSVKLDAFEGPLDLLLHLIKKNEVDIYNIPVSEITRQYLEYIEILKELNLDLAGEFIVLASTLIQIKSKMLLPILASEEDTAEETEDPRAELVRRLIEYQRYKAAALDLDRQPLVGRDIFVHAETAETMPEKMTDLLPVDVDPYQLLAALQNLLKKLPPAALHEVGADTVHIADRIAEILALLDGGAAVSFEDLFPETFSREYVVATFLAMLELCRQRLINLTQPAAFASIWLTRAVQAE